MLEYLVSCCFCFYLCAYVLWKLICSRYICNDYLSYFNVWKFKYGYYSTYLYYLLHTFFMLSVCWVVCVFDDVALGYVYVYYLVFFFVEYHADIINIMINISGCKFYLQKLCSIIFTPWFVLCSVYYLVLFTVHQVAKYCWDVFRIKTGCWWF